jgi:MerR family transcriptional regulator/heat shock protein HspR
MRRRTELATRQTTQLTPKVTRQGETTVITVAVAARQTGLTTHTVRRYIRRGLLSEALAEADLAELRRIRRLTGLGVNLAGVEIVLQMRRNIVELQAEVDRLQTLLNTEPGDTDLW